MPGGPEQIRWAPRLRRHLVRRLYELDAAGIVDQELIDEVGIGLLARCEAVLTVERARLGLVRCPVCQRGGQAVDIQRPPGLDTPLRCPDCSWTVTWREYARTTKRRQLNPGGAVAAFRRFVRDYPLARTPQRRMLAIDAVIHAFHYSLRSQPDLPCRAAAVNLIEGRLGEVVAFLDGLTYGDGNTPGLAEAAAAWRGELARIPWFRPAGLDGDAAPDAADAL